MPEGAAQSEADPAALEEAARSFRLLPGERMLWLGRPVADVPRPLGYVVTSLVAGGVAIASVLFAMLLRVAELPGSQVFLLVAFNASVFVAGATLAPRHLLDPCEFALSDRRVLWRRGMSVRSIDRGAISFARIRWHRSVYGVGTLELIRAVPFGPLMRQERLVLHDVRSPNAILSMLRGRTRHIERDGESALFDLLEPDEAVLWAGHPSGWLLGWRDLATASLGVGVLLVGLHYGASTFGALRSLEEVGLPVGSEIWWLFFAASLASLGILLAVGGGLAWWGLFRARAEGRSTEYVVTDRRVLIRRGRTELSLDRSRIVDLAAVRSYGGRQHVFFLLDGPGGRALGDSGVLRGLLPSRDLVAPILYDVDDVTSLQVLFEPPPREASR